MDFLFGIFASTFSAERTKLQGLQNIQFTPNAKHAFYIAAFLYWYQTKQITYM